MIGNKRKGKELEDAGEEDEQRAVEKEIVTTSSKLRRQARDAKSCRRESRPSSSSLPITWTNGGRVLYAPDSSCGTIRQLKEWLASAMGMEQDQGFKVSVGDIDITEEDQREVSYYRVNSKEMWFVHSPVEILVHHEEPDKEPVKLVTASDIPYERLLLKIERNGLAVDRHMLVTKEGVVIPDEPSGRPLRSLPARVELHLRPNPDIVELTILHPPGFKRSGVGERTKLMVKKNKKISAMKEEIRKRRSIPESNLRLTLQGEEVHDDQFLSDLGIVLDGSALQLSIVPEEAKEKSLDDPIVVLVSLTRDKLNIELVGRNEPIGNLPGWETFYRVRLVLAETRNFLDGSKTWADCGFEDGTWLRVIPDPEVEFMIFIRTMKGKTISLDVEATDDVYDLNMKLFQKEGIPPDAQRLLFAGKQLSQRYTLTSYGIKENATLLLTQRLTGGGVRFVDMADDDALEQQQWSTDAPRWRMVEPGLSIEGVCNNSSCSAHGEMVIVNLGFTTFDLALDASGCECPVCSTKVTPTTCGFNNCWWKWNGVKQGPEDDKQEHSKGWTKAGDAYHRFDEDEAGVVEWSRLLIHTRPIDTSGPRAAPPRAPSDMFCCICITQIAHEDMNVKRLRCRHIYHKECINGWLARSASCPLCRQSLA